MPAVLIFLWMLNPNFGVMNVFAGFLPWTEHNPTWLRGPDYWPEKGLPCGLVIRGTAGGSPGRSGRGGSGRRRWQVFFRGDAAGDLADALVAHGAGLYLLVQAIHHHLAAHRGGPVGATETIAIRIYNTAFRFTTSSYGVLGVAGFVRR